MKTIIIAGSARNDGDTMNMVENLANSSGWDVIDLNQYKFSYYDYAHENREDDFLILIREIIENHDVLIFATPVYWYSMSGIMKVFFDRLSDLLTIEKDLGRALRGKSMAVITTSNGSNLGDSFWLPFQETAKYMGMNYCGHLHTYKGKNEPNQLKDFIQMLEQ